MPAPLAEKIALAGVKMPLTWHKALKSHAEKRGTSLSVEMRIAIQQYLRAEGLEF